MLRQRILSAAVFIPILLAAIWFGDPWFPLVVGAAAVLGLWEFYTLAAQKGWQPFGIFGLLCVVLFILCAHFGGSHTALVLSGVVVCSLIWPIFRSEVEKAFANWALTLGGVMYLGWLLGFWILLHHQFGREWTLLALLATFAVDTSAYFVGRALGSHALASKISPGKTWEGVAGGLVGGVVTTIVLALILGLTPSIGWGWLLFLGLLIGVFAPLGDLSESLLKRSLGAKDAGRLIPGHGGILDRLDSILFTGVVVYFYLTWVI